jgi:hypothetical protein
MPNFVGDNKMRTIPEPEKMWAHSMKVLDVVDKVFIANPRTVGDKRLLVFETWKRYGVRISFNWHTKEIFLKFRNWEHMRRVPSAETITRRGRELRKEDRERKEQGLPKRYSITEYSKAKSLTLEDMYKSYYAKAGASAPLTSYE